ncbi:threonine synthase [Candidatus Kaiserbacteria bacterium]|nr:threonine synthase [Candidatus Kaiserbacteria bacterium]
MRYVSTRGNPGSRAFLDILLEGLAPDGGLYVPEEYPRISQGELQAMRGMGYSDVAFKILSKFIDDIPGEDLKKLVDATYTEEVFGKDIVPLKELEPGFFILGLSNGPTLAFKDIALQFLGRLFEYALSSSGEELNILGATSGDTGSAAEYAMRGRKGVRVFMLSPYGRMSDFQRKQMYTLDDANIFNIAIKGTFDDCQDAVKKVNDDASFKKEFNLGAVNSINWARIAAQVVYYVWGYLKVSRSNEEQVSFAVPTGNFGNILAGYVARKMGVPIKQLVLATNENDVLEEFFRTGVYRPRKGSEVAVTSSPSMDISKASNFERYIFDLVGRDAARMSELWGNLTNGGSFNISPPEIEKTRQDGFVAGSSTHEDRLRTIKSVFELYGVLIDPHTADGLHVGLEHREKDIPLLCLETALPVKFEATIREAVGKNPELPTGYRELEGKKERFEIQEADAERIKSFIREHVNVVS